MITDVSFMVKIIIFFKNAGLCLLGKVKKNIVKGCCHRQ
jgi:hypothetical protein